MNTNETVGAAVLLPLRIVAAVVAAALLLLAWLPVSLIVLWNQRNEPIPLGDRFIGAFGWPLMILTFNEFVSLGGLDNPLLSKISRLLTVKFRPTETARTGE